MRVLLLLVVVLLPLLTAQWFGGGPHFGPPPQHREFHGGHDSVEVEDETEVIHKKKIKHRHHEQHGIEDSMEGPPPPHFHGPHGPPGLGLPPPHIGLQNLLANLHAGVNRLLAPLFYGK